MTEQPNQSPEGTKRRFVLKFRSLWFPQVDDASVEEQAARIIADTGRLVPRLVNAAIWVDFGLLFCSTVATVLGHYLDFDAVAAVGGVSTLLFAFPTARDTREAWQRVRGSGGNSSKKSWTGRILELGVRGVRHRRLSKLFAQYGRQEMAARVFEKNSPWFTVKAQVERRRRCHSALIALALLIAAGLSVHSLFFVEKFKDVPIGAEFDLGETFSLAVNGASICRKASGSEQKDTCSLPITVRNKTEDPRGLGAGSFGYIYSQGPDFQLYDGPPLNYATSMRGPDGYYTYSSETPYLASSDMDPKGKVSENLLYDVPFDAKINQVQFQVRGERTRIRVKLSER